MKERGISSGLIGEKMTDQSAVSSQTCRRNNDDRDRPAIEKQRGGDLGGGATSGLIRGEHAK